ncbi:MAG: hypothetical protein R2733_11740 [Acidimicrobiales bacterium]
MRSPIPFGYRKTQSTHLSFTASYRKYNNAVQISGPETPTPAGEEDEIHEWQTLFEALS